MTSRQSRVLLALCVVPVLAIISCKPTPSPAGLAVKQVTISNCIATPDPVTLSVKAGDQVRWVNADAVGSYTIMFTPPSPFTAGTTFPLPQGGSVSSGGISSSAAQCAHTSGSCTYKYTVAGSNGCSQDPRVIIQQ